MGCNNKGFDFFCFNGKPAPIGVTHLCSQSKNNRSRWWFQIFVYFHPYLGKISNLTYIFQMGWNHQPESNLPIQNDELFDFRQNWKIKGFAPRKRCYHSSLWQDSAWLETPWILEWLRFEFSEDFEGVGFCQVNKTHIFRWHYFNLGVSNKRPWTSFSGWEPEKLKVWEDDVIQVFSASMLVPGRHMCVHIYIYTEGPCVGMQILWENNVKTL